MVLVGSSPLARGTCLHPVGALHLVRLIPARAGNIAIFSVTVWLTKAHPRSRGEHLPAIGPKARYCGSSPLARGT